MTKIFTLSRMFTFSLAATLMLISLNSDAQRCYGGSADWPSGFYAGTPGDGNSNGILSTNKTQNIASTQYFQWDGVAGQTYSFTASGGWANSGMGWNYFEVVNGSWTRITSGTGTTFTITASRTSPSQYGWNLVQVFNNTSCPPSGGVTGTSATLTYRRTNAPLLNGVSTNSSCWNTNGSNTYQVTMSSSNSGDDWGGPYGIMGLINFQGTNAGNYGGYFSWNKTISGLNAGGYTLDQVACTGGGFVGKYAGAYGDNTITLTGGTTSVNNASGLSTGYTRTVTFNIVPNTNFPQAGAINGISQYTSDAASQARGWANNQLNFQSSYTALSGITPSVTPPICGGSTINLTATGVGGSQTGINWWTGSGGTGKALTFPNGVGGFFNYDIGASNAQIALNACESVYGAGGCNTGVCGSFTYYKRAGATSCDCAKPVGEYEFIYSNTGYTQVGQDYGGQTTNVSGMQLFTRVKTSAGCDGNSWTLAQANLGSLSTIPSGTRNTISAGADQVYYARATSACGGAVEQSINVNLETTAPTSLTAPAQTIYNSPNNSERAAGVMSPTASDNCSGEARAVHDVLTGIGNLRLWTKADAGVVVDGTGKVARWRDISGNGNHFTQANFENRPTLITSTSLNNQPAIALTNTQFLTNVTNLGAGSTAYTMFTISRQTQTSGRLISSASTNWLFGYWSGAKDKLYCNGWISASASNSPAADVIPNLYTVTSTGVGGTTIMYRNGTNLSLPTPNAAGSDGNARNGPGQIQLNGWNGGLNEPSAGEVAEVIYFDKVLSGSERQIVEGYLGFKYNLQVPLASMQAFQTYALGSNSTTLLGTDRAGNRVTATSTFTGERYLGPTVTPNATSFCVGPNSTFTLSGMAPAGNRLSCAASADYLNVSPNPAVGSNWTIEAWYDASSLPANTGGWNTLIRGTNFHHIIIDRGGNGGSTTGQIGVYQGGFFTSGFNIINNVTSGWHHIAAVGTGGRTTFYIDGVFVGTANAQPTDNIVAIGNFQGGGQHFGQVDEVRIWNTTLPQNTISNFMTRGITSSHPNWSNLISYYKMDGNGNDSKGSSNGTLTGGATASTAVGYYSYSITNGIGGTLSPASPSTAESYTITSPTSTGSIDVTASANTRNSTTTSSGTIIITPLPTASISGSQTICSGSSSTFTASGGATYAWSTGTTTADVSLSTAGTYTVTVTTSGCSSTASRSLTVNDNPTAFPSFAANPICPSTSTTLSANAAAGSGTISTYAWSSVLGNVANGSVSNTGTYTVTVTNSNGCTVSATSPSLTNKNLSVAPTGASTSNNNYCANGIPPSINLTANLGTLGTGAVVQWYTGSCGGTLVGTGNPLTLSGGAVPSTTTTYFARYAGDCNTTTCATVTVSVIQSPSVAPTTVTVTPSSNCTGSLPATIQLIASGGTPGTGGTANWYTDSCGGTFLANGSSPTIVNPGATTTYFVRYENSCGSTICGAVTYIVNPLPTPSIIGSNTICAGGSSTFTASGGSSYAWNTGALTAAITVSTAGTYTVTATDANGCTATSSQLVTVNSRPTAAISGTATICNGQSTDLTITLTGTGPFSGTLSSGASFSGNSPITVSVTPSSNTTYTIATLSDANCTATAGDLSGSVSITIDNNCGSVWNGSQSTAWNVAANWTPAIIPNGCGFNVTIPKQSISVPRQPEIANAAYSVGNITLEDDAFVLLSDANGSLNVCKDITGGSGNGSAFNGVGRVIFKDGTAQHKIDGVVFADIIQLDDTDGAGFVAGGILNVSGVLELKNGTFTTTGGTLRFKSNSVSSAAILDNFSPSFSGTIIGTVESERFYAAATDSRLHNQHYFGSPLNQVPVTQFAPAKGVNGVAVTPTPDCDETKTAANGNYGNVFEWEEDLVTNCYLEGWKVRSSGNTENARGYSVVKIGSGTLTLTGTPNLNQYYELSGLTNTSSGTTVSKQNNVFNFGWNLVANPYQAPIDLDDASNADFDDNVLILRTHGMFPGTFQPVSMLGNGLLAPFQGFLVRKSNVGGTSTFRINASDRRVATSTFHKSTDHQMNLMVVGNGYADITYLNFDPNATEQYDARYDALKAASSTGQPTLFTYILGNWSSINSNPDVITTPTVRVGFKPGANGTFMFQGEGFDEVPNTTVYLEDLRDNVMQNLTAIPDYTFTSSVNDADDRFLLHFRFEAPNTVKDVRLNDFRFSMYPNPTSGTLFLETDLKEDVKVEITDMNGKVVIATEMFRNKTIDVSMLASAIYQVRITSAQGSVVKRLVKE